MSTMSMPCEIETITRQQLGRQLQRFRKEGIFIPVVIGTDDDLLRFAENYAFSERDSDEIRAAAGNIKAENYFIRREEDWKQRHRRDAEEMLRISASDPNRFSDDIGRDIIADYRRRVAEDDFRVSERLEVLGKWPVRQRSSPDLILEMGSWSFAHWPEVGKIFESYSARNVALLKVKDDAEIFAILKAGGWGTSPQPEEHMAVFRYWQQKYECELFLLDDHKMLCTVASPPENQAEAMELAWEQFFYCPAILDHGPRSVSELAALLLKGPSWAFWWD